MKNLVVNYKVFNDKVNKKIVTLADLHDYPGARKTTIAQDIDKLSPDFVIMAGDTLHGGKFAIDNISYQNLKKFLSELSEICPVIMGIGNHDLFGKTIEFDKAYRELEKARPGRVFPLNNESVISSDVRIVEFHPRHSAFAPASQESGYALTQYIEDLEKYGITPTENSKLFNILISHNPKIFAQARSLAEQRKLDLTQEQMETLRLISQIMKRFDLGVSGHLHNGYRKLKTTIKNPEKYMDYGYWEMPMEKDINGRVKFIRPWVFKKTDMCRGTIYVGDGEERILLLANGEYYYKRTKDSKPVLLGMNAALSIIKEKEMTPITISGGVNKFFNIPIDKSEITQIKVLKK